MSDTARPAETVSESVPAHHATPDVAELRDQIAGTIHRRICEHSREDCIENLGKCERATDSAMPLISTALDEGHAMARLLADALKDAIRTLRELAEKAAGEPIPFGDFDLYAEVVDGALDAAAERDALAAKVERVRALADEWTYNGEFGWDDGSHAYGPDCEGQALDYAAAKLRRALDEEPQS